VSATNFDEGDWLVDELFEVPFVDWEVVLPLMNNSLVVIQKIRPQSHRYIARRAGFVPASNVNGSRILFRKIRMASLLSLPVSPPYHAKKTVETNHANTTRARSAWAGDQQSGNITNDGIAIIAGRNIP
jgi:hypothetical protein